MCLYSVYRRIWGAARIHNGTFYILSTKMPAWVKIQLGCMEQKTPTTGVLSKRELLLCPIKEVRVQAVRYWLSRSHSFQGPTDIPRCCGALRSQCHFLVPWLLYLQSLVRWQEDRIQQRENSACPRTLKSHWILCLLSLVVDYVKII